MNTFDPSQPTTPAEDGALEQTAGTRAFRGGLWQSAAQVAPYAYSLVISIVAARILGPDQMGRQSYIAFVVVIVQFALSGGLNNALLRYTGALIGRGREHVLVSLAAWATPVCVIVGVFGALGLVLAAMAGAAPPWAWIFAAIAVLAGVVGVVPGAVLLGAQEWRPYAQVALITGAGSVVATVVVLELGGGVSGMLGVIAVTAVARYIWTEVLSRRLLGSFGPVREPLGSLRTNLLIFSLAMTIPVALNLVVNQRSEFFFLEHFSSDEQIALYSIAFQATAALIAIPRAIGAILTPSVAGLVGAGDFDRIRRGFSRVLRLSLLFSLPLTAAGLALGPDLLQLLYGSRYAGAGDVLLVVVLTVPLAPLAGASSALLVGYGHARAPIVASAIAAAWDIGLALVLIPRLDAIGAAIANTCASFVATTLLLIAAVQAVGGVQLGWSSIFRVAGISTLAAAGARLVLLAGASVGLFLLATVVLLSLLVAGAMAVRAVPEEDASFLIRVVGRRGRFARVLERLSDRSLRAAA
jgi:O-antigen/teichoic acid export membrane protein